MVYTIDDVTLDGAEPGSERPLPPDAFVWDDEEQKFVLNFDETKYTDDVNPYPPGTYTITIRGTVEGSDGPATETTTVTLTIPDLCDPPTSITPSSMTN